MKPNLAAKVTDVHNDIGYPVFVSPKLDGVRCLIINGIAVSRNLKPIPNRVVSEVLRDMPAMDGELIVGPPHGPDVFNRTSSGVMSRDGVPKFTYWVFDALTNAPMQFNERYDLMKRYVNSVGSRVVQPVIQKFVKTPEALLAYEADMLLAGYEGIMIRSPNGLYKQGRSTVREGGLLKLKRFEDGEAEVIGFVEKERNDNEQTRDELGRAKRSSHKSGKRAAGTLGALIVKDRVSGVQFQIGSGFSESERADVWGDRGSFLGRLVKYKFQAVGVKEAPRFPTFIGWRSEADG